MKKIGLIIVISTIIILGISFFVFDKFYLIVNWKLIPRSTYNLILLDDALSDSFVAGDVDKTIEIAQKLTEIKKDNESRLDLAHAYLEKASLDFKEVEYGNKALSIANEIIASDPNNVEAYLVAGYSYEVLQDYQKTIESYNKAIEIDPKNEISYVKRGHAYDLMGDLVSAETDYLKALEINNQNDVALMNMARIALRKGDIENLEIYAKKTLDISEINYVKSVAYELLGTVHLERGLLNSTSSDFSIANSEYSQSALLFSKAIDSYSKSFHSYVNRAYVQILMSNYEIKIPELKSQIESDLIKALEINKNSSFAMFIYGLFSEAIDDKSKAIEYYEKAQTMIDSDISLGQLEKQNMKNKIAERFTLLNKVIKDLKK